jgi:hypothetical protein
MSSSTGRLIPNVKMAADRRGRVRGLATRRLADAIRLDARESIDHERAVLERLARRIDHLAARSWGLRGWTR